MSTWHAGSKVAVFGAREKSLGAHIVETLYYQDDCDVETHGPGRDIDGDLLHDHEFEWSDSCSFTRYLLEPYDNVVVTLGINLPDEEDPLGRKQMEVNYFAVMALAEQWARLEKPGHFVAISSNSAHIARSTSIGYCASKAALSMGIRGIGRREAKVTSKHGIFYAWEFGLLAGTPMTDATVAGLPEGVAPSRIPGLQNGLPVDQAARHVCNALRYGWQELNGCTLRLDGGEQ